LSFFLLTVLPPPNRMRDSTQPARVRGATVADRPSPEWRDEPRHDHSCDTNGLIAGQPNLEFISHDQFTTVAKRGQKSNISSMKIVGTLTGFYTERVQRRNA
jgi:hypothetical protein